MNEREHNDLMRKCLTSDVHWRAQTASPEGRAEIKEWLKTAARRVNTDGHIKAAELAAAKAAFGSTSTRYRQEAAKYHAWRASSLRFASMVAERLALLPDKTYAPRVAANARGEGKDAALARAQAHGERMSAERSKFRGALLDLARAVEQFERGDATVRDLAGLLDTLRVPDRNDLDGASLRQLIDMQSVGADT